jgi:hypothetical protein
MMIFVPHEGFFELHSHSYGEIKRQNMGQKGHFFSQLNSF